MTPSSSVLPLGWTPRSIAEKFQRAMDDYRRDVGERIRHLREQREMTQEDLADAIGVRAKTISRWENGRNEALRDNARKVAGALGVEAELILGTPPAPLALGASNGGTDQLDRIEQQLAAQNTMLTRILNLLEGRATDDPAGDTIENLVSESDEDASDAATRRAAAGNAARSDATPAAPQAPARGTRRA